MNNLLKNLLLKLVPCSGFVALAVSPVFAQSPRTEIADLKAPAHADIIVTSD